MKPVELKVARIGNSRGVRIPAATLARYGIGDAVVMEERSDGILLRVPGPASPKLSWEETGRAMAASVEDWSAWDASVADGLDEIVWESEPKRRVAEPSAKYKKKHKKERRTR
jgi:antitoxin MazE